MTIIVAYASDPQSRTALAFATSEAAVRGEDVVVVNSSRGAAPVDRHLADEDELRHIHAVLDAAEVTHRIEQPNRGQGAVEEVLAAIEDHDASMVVIGARKRTPVGKLILGSIAQQIILQAEVPVVTVKPI